MKPQDDGRLAEDAAERLYAARGGRILARNLHTPYAEIDLLVDDGGVLALVEVKARAGNAAYAVSTRQRQRLTRAALHLLAQRGSLDVPVRFDVVAFDTKTARVEHIVGAWDASSRTGRGYR